MARNVKGVGIMLTKQENDDLDEAEELWSIFAARPRRLTLVTSGCHQPDGEQNHKAASCRETRKAQQASEHLNESLARLTVEQLEQLPA